MNTTNKLINTSNTFNKLPEYIQIIIKDIEDLNEIGMAFHWYFDKELINKNWEFEYHDDIGLVQDLQEKKINLLLHELFCSLTYEDDIKLYKILFNYFRMYGGNTNYMINNPKSIYNNKTLLYYACANNCLDIVKFLMENGADPNMKCVVLISPFRIACCNKNLEVVKYLLSYKYFDIDLYQKNIKGRTILASIKHNYENTKYPNYIDDKIYYDKIKQLFVNYELKDILCF